MIFIICCFTSCSNPPTSNLQNTTEANLYMVTNEYGLLGNNYASTDNGCYEIFSYSDFHANIIYTDYTNKCKLFLSSDPATDPFSPNNTSYLSDRYGMMVPVTTKEKLLVFHHNSPSAIDWYGNKSLSSITSMDFNGENKNKFYTFAANEWMHTESGIACDTNNIYFIESILSSEGLTEDKKIVKINISSGEKEDIITLDNDDRWFIIGAFNDKLIIKKISVPNNDSPWYSQIKSQEYDIITLCTSTKQTKKIISYVQGSMDIVCNKNYIYLLDADKQKISSLDISSGEEKDIFYIYNNTINDVKYENITLRKDYFDDHILIEGVKPNNHIDFIAIDTNQKNATKLELYSNDKFCGIFAENENYFYIQVGSIDYEIDIDSPDGNSYSSFASVLEMALIEKDDYWNNIPNYITIKDYVYKQ